MMYLLLLIGTDLCYSLPLVTIRRLQLGHANSSQYFGLCTKPAEK
uniref:Uncharacterized protein n=1 Tax=Anguilla anguilla TaxID=7936 RepID=A0A0E9UDL5_ANGAN